MSRVQALSVLAGYTLFELLIVVFLVATLAAVAAPWFVKISRRSQLRSAALEIETTLLAARMRAVKRNLPASVLIVATPSETGSYRFETIEPDPPAPTPTPTPVQRLYLSSKSLRFVSLPSPSKITFDGSGRRIFPPDPTPGTIVFEGPVGLGAAAVNQITIDTAVSGRVKIITPVVWR